MAENKISERVDEVMQDDEQVLSYWEDYCFDNRRDDDMVYEMSSDNLDMVTGGDVEKALMMAFYSRHFNPNDTYFKLDGYGNFESSRSLIDLIDREELEEWLYDKFKEEEGEEEEEEEEEEE